MASEHGCAGHSVASALGGVALAALLLLLTAPRVAADVLRGGRALDASRVLVIAVDDDDDDEDNTPDNRQQRDVPPDDVIELTVRAQDATPVTLSVVGGLRLLRGGAVVSLPLTLAPAELPTTFAIQASRASTSNHPAALRFDEGGKSTRIPVRAIGLAVLDGRGRRLDASRDALALARRITNDDSLPRGTSAQEHSGEINDVRIQVFDAVARGKRVRARLQSLTPDGARVRSAVALTLSRDGPGGAFHSRFVRLVGDDVDASARGVDGQVLKVGLRDRVRIVYEAGGGNAQHSLRVARPGDESGPLAARQAALRVTVLRMHSGGPPVVGTDELSALRIVRDELAIANEIWLQCLVTLGPPSEASVQLADPPGSTLLSVSDGDGLPARGGVVRFSIDGRAFGPIQIPAGSTPQQTALRIEQRLRGVGFQTSVTVNPVTVFGAAPSADVLVRRPDGEFVSFDVVPGLPLSTDLQQRIALGFVNLKDGLAEFDNMNAQSGTLEERTLIKALSDDDPSTVELFIVNRFTRGTRQGEAFIAASSGSIVNTLVLDRNGLRQRQTAWTLAHELGHVLLNQPLHPDNIGQDAPMLLMDSDNNRGTVNGPKRLLPGECARVRHESGRRAYPPLLVPYDARPARPSP